MLFNIDLLDSFPKDPGVYLMKDKKGKVLYVGKAKNLKNRVKNYFSSSSDTRAMIPFLIKETATIDTLIVHSEEEALLVENTLIKNHKPKYNACLKDDKSFITLTLDLNDPWPRLQLLRYKGAPPKETLCFGPYTSPHAARETYDLLASLFPLRQCSNEEFKRRTRPCLLHAIKRCCAPCVSKCTPEEYKGYVTHTISFLKGENKQVLKDLYQEMEEASEALSYEKAAVLLKKIRHIEHVIDSPQVVYKAEGKNTDALHFLLQEDHVILVLLFFREGKLTGSEHFFFENILETEEELLTSFLLQHYSLQNTLPEELLVPLPLPSSLSKLLKIKVLCPQKGEKKELLELAYINAKALFTQKQEQKEQEGKLLLDLQELLKLSRYPKRIECFDTSHIQGAYPVAAMVAFTEGRPDRKRYRLFAIKEAKPGDDYGALKEALERRLKKALLEEDLPDLLLIDGGKGHLNAAYQILQKLEIASVDLISISKENARHDKGITQEKVYLLEDHDPIVLQPTSSHLFLLQQIRDEAHRKAITFHKNKRSKGTFKSALDEIPGIGKVKKEKLLLHFGSVAKIKAATKEELLMVQGISPKDVDALHKKLTK